MATYSILNNAIGLIMEQRRNVNGVPGIKYFFGRKTVDTTMPIEISFVSVGGSIHAVCKQVHDGKLDIVAIDGVECWTYKNDIIFYKNEIADALGSIDEESVQDGSVETVRDMFGIDLSGVTGISGFSFDKIVYIDRLDAETTSDYFDGYMMIFTDISTRSLKMGVFAGQLLPYTYQDYLDRLNEYGRDRVLSEIIVTNAETSTIVSNNSKLRVKLTMDKYKYVARHVAYGDKNYVKEDVDSIDFVLEPGETKTFVHSKTQSEATYSLLANPINPPSGPIYARDFDEYTKARKYIAEEPFKFSLKEVHSFVGINEPDMFIMVSSFHNIFEDRGAFEKAILDKRDNIDGVPVSGKYGTVVISDGEKFKEFIANGGSNTFIDRAKVSFRAKLRRIYSYLGEDQMNMIIDYTLASSRFRVLSIDNRIVYNDTISTPQQSVSVTVGLIGNIDDILTAGAHIEYKGVIPESSLPCKTDRDAVIRKIMRSEMFSSDYLRFNANDVLNNPTKKVYSGPLYRTYDGEMDDAYEMLQEQITNEISGFSMINFDSVLTSEEVAAVMPSLNINSEFSDGCREDFVYSVEENIGELGLEYNLNEVLKKMRKVAYVYRRSEEIIATINIGATLDGEWYFCGEDFYPAESVNRNEFTTFLDNEIVSLERDGENGLRYLSDKKIFLDSNDWGEDYKQYMHDTFLAFVTGSIKTSTIYDNPGMKYIADHLFDSNEKLSFSYDEMFTNAKDAIYSRPVRKVRNTMIMPNIFNQLVEAGKIGYEGFVGDDNTHVFSKAKVVYSKNYADLNVHDAYDSAYEIGHTISAMVNIDSINAVGGLYPEYGKMMFGINIGEFSVTDSVSVSKRTNVYHNGQTYGLSIDVVSGTEMLFSMMYDYKSKNIKFINHKNLEIVQFPMLLAVFDIFVHDFYKSLEGMKRVALGVYDFYDTDLGEELSKKYLFVNRTYEPSSRFSIHHIRVGVFDDAVMLDTLVDGESKSMSFYYGEGHEIPFSVENTGDGLSITKAGDTVVYSIDTLSNFPSDRLYADGYSITMYRTKKFLPTRYIDRSLTRALIKFTGTTSGVEDSGSVVGTVVVVDFDEARAVDAGNVGEIGLALGGEGLKAWIRNGNFATEPAILFDIDDIMQNTEDVFSTDIIGYTIEVSFE